MGLLDLPNELLLAIILLIGGFDILPCRLLCKRVQELIDHSAESQLSIELASECLALAPWNGVPAATLLDRLLRSREAWQTLRPTREKTIPLQMHIDDTYKVWGYMFAQGKPVQIRRPFELARLRMLEFWEMPVGGLIAAEVVEMEGEREDEREDERTRGWHRKYMDIGMDVVNFAFDPSQDALCFVEKQGSSYIFHVRTLSNNLHHPDAKMIKMAMEGPRQLDRCDLHIRDCYIAALIVHGWEDENVFTMWNWKGGECVLHELGVFSYTFLDACTPLLVVEKDDRIAFTTRSLSRPGGANSNSKSETKAKYLMFPDLSEDLSDDVEYNRTVVFHDSEPLQPKSSPKSFSRATVPAHTDHGVVALSIGTIKADPDTTDGGEHAEHLVFFLRETLARLFQQEQECSLEAEGEGEASYVVDWADWGPKASRWFDSLYSEQRRYSVHGYRFVTLVTPFETRDFFPSFYHAKQKEQTQYYHLLDTLHLLVFDFNPYLVRRYQHSPATDNNCPSSNGISNICVDVIAPSDQKFHNRDQHFHMKSFEQLACRVTLMEEPVDYDTLAICEDNIIGIQTVSRHGTGGLGHVRVLTF